MNPVTDKLIKVLGVVLLLLSLGVSIPLTISTLQEGGGPWGFGVIGLPVLLPLSACLLFGIAGLQQHVVKQREFFIGAQIITLITGIVSFFIFPVLPVFLFLLPVLLSTIGIINKRQFKFFLWLMITLAIMANILLLKWEFDFGRTIPLLQFFESGQSPDP